MDSEELLREIGLTKYESAAYSTLINEGIIGAQELSQKSKIPVGKVYETLTNLNNYGFVEIQKSRPRKYMAVKPKIALNSLYLKKKEETKNEIDLFKKKISEIEQRFEDKNYPEHAELKFWSTAIGEKDLMKAIKSFFEEAEEEYIDIHSRPSDDLPCTDEIVSLALEELVRMAKKGVKARFIVPESALITEFKKKYSSIKDENLKKQFSKSIEVRMMDTQHNFSVVDGHIVTFPIQDPLDPDKMIGNVKIYDEDYAMRLKEKFNELWVKGEKTTLE